MLNEPGPRPRMIVICAITPGSGLVLVLLLGYAMRGLVAFAGTFRNVLFYHCSGSHSNYASATRFQLSIYCSC